MFEVHITTAAMLQNEIPDFINFCQSIDVKPILIELEDGDTTQQPMISKVINNVNGDELKSRIASLETAFVRAGYRVMRTKVEVPLNYIDEGELAFPNYRGKYFEWHGKVKYSDFESLKNIPNWLNVHLSRNSLKGEINQRFLTYRNFRSEGAFRYDVNNIKQNLKNKNLELTKEEYEYCVFDSNKKVDSGWIETPEITDEEFLNLLAYEGFLRRTSTLKEPFILKGSILTRQYLKDRNYRISNDIDFVYAHPIDSDDDASEMFSSWVTKVTETYENDNVEFRSFKENDFWRGIDYAMSDDFPTTNTDLYCELKGRVLEALSLDISWNLPIDEKPVELLYHPQEGPPFLIPYTVPLTLQISWKLHQSIVRPRTKDLLDVVLLLENNLLTEHDVERIAHHFSKECTKDEIDPKRILYYINGEVSELYASKISEILNQWKVHRTFNTGFGFVFENGFNMNNLNHVFRTKPKYDRMKDLISHFENCLKQINIADKIR